MNGQHVRLQVSDFCKQKKIDPILILGFLTSQILISIFNLIFLILILSRGRTKLNNNHTLTLSHTGDDDLDGAAVVGHRHRRVCEARGGRGGPGNGATNAALAFIAKTDATLGRLLDQVSIRLWRC